MSSKEGTEELQQDIRCEPRDLPCDGVHSKVTPWQYGVPMCHQALIAMAQLPSEGSRSPDRADSPALAVDQSVTVAPQPVVTPPALTVAPALSLGGVSSSPHPTSHQVTPGRSLYSPRSGAISPEIFRGVPLSRLLQRRMLPWRTGPSGLTTSRQGQLWSLSSPVPDIDRFLSHAWRAPGWTKLLQLTLRNGLVHGVVGSLVVLAVVAACTYCDMLPHADIQGVKVLGWVGQVKISFWCTTLGPLAALLFTFLSPALPRLCGRDPVVFLDVACICQTDESMKQAGIEGLGGFLLRSRALYIMWSPEYFSRLWCVYELAVFRRIHGGRAIHFHPLFMEIALLLYFVLNWFSCVLFMVCTTFHIHAGSTPFATIAACQSLLFAGMHVLRRCMRDKHALANQLKDFDVRKAECQEQADRDRILRGIQRWYGSEDSFNEQIRGEVRQEVLHSLPAINMPYSAALLNGSCAPLCTFLDICLALLKAGLPAPGLVSFLLYGGAAVLFLGPTFARLFFHLAERYAAKAQSRLLDGGISFLLFAAWEICVVLFKGFGMMAFKRSMLESFVVAAGSAVFAWVVFRWAKLSENRAFDEGNGKEVEDASDQSNFSVAEDVESQSQGTGPSPPAGTGHCSLDIEATTPINI